MRFLPTRYHFSTLWHQEALGGSNAEPFAVIVESNRYVYCIAFGLAGDDSTVTGQVLKHFPDILKEQVVKASRRVRGAQGLALEELRRGLSWNIYADEPASKLGFGTIEEFTHKLFAQRVENWAASPARTEMTDAAPVRASYTFKLGPSYAFAT